MPLEADWSRERLRGLQNSVSHSQHRDRDQGFEERFPHTATEAARNQKAIWRQAKELLHSDDRPPPPIRPRDVSKLCECDGISRFFYDKLKTSA